MSTMHKVTVAKKNMHPGTGSKSHWVASCSCGQWQGYYNKLDALLWADKHKKENK